MRNLKKVVALVAVFAMLVSSVAFGQTFSDVADDANYYEAIEMLNGLSILTGDDQDGDGVMDFRPEDTITRAEVAAVISRIQGINSAAQTDTVFTDVTASHWASGYVAQAAGQGIVNGYGDGTFGPENPVLYEQAVKMIVETLGYAPFVEENGGYYAGHMTAASRYGVLEGVIGGTIGKEATRGQVAQMLYNAVDTPLMERQSYGDEASYVIYNGFSSSAANYVTLLKRDLKVKKFEAYVKANQYTTYTAGKTIDTEKPATIALQYTGADVNSYYEVGAMSTILVGDTNAADFIGKQVTGYAKATGISGQYELIAIAETSLNKTVSFTLDNYAGYSAGEVEYYTDKANGIKTSVKLDSIDAVFYNGVAFEDAYYDTGSNDTDGNDIYAWAITDNASAPAAVFGGTKGIVKTPNDTGFTAISGQVTLVDNDTNPGYDVIYVEMAKSAVVDEVSTNGRIKFKGGNPASPISGVCAPLNILFSDEITDTVINLTKNGEAIDYTELKEWDVISAKWYDEAKIVDLEVLDSSVIEGKVTQSKNSPTSATASTAWVIDGVAYDVAAGAYQASNIKLGAAGLFYVDAYGKIVAYDKNGTASASDNYAYVLAATETEDDWGQLNLRVQLLAKDGNVYEAYLASEVEISNNTGIVSAFRKDAAAPALGNVYDVLTTGDVDTVEDTFKLADLIPDLDDEELNAIELDNSGASTLKAALQNTLITYEANAQGEIDAIGIAQIAGDPDTAELNGWLHQATAGTASASTYDEEDNEFNGIGSTTEDTLVFYINGEVSLSYNDTTNMASKTKSQVASAATLGDITGYDYAIYDVDSSEDIAVVVIYDMIGGISSSTNVAVIDSVGQAVVDGEKVAVVEFFLNGEKKTAYTSSNTAGATINTTNTAEGDVYKFAFNADGTVITNARKLVDHAGRGTTIDGSVQNFLTKDGGLSLTESANILVGPAVKYNADTQRITLAAWNAGSWDIDGNTVANVPVKAADANVYVYDMNKIANKVYVASASDINVDKDLIDAIDGSDDKLDAGKNVKKYDNAQTPLLTTDEYVDGLLDYVAAFVYDNDVIDVVIYKPYDFGTAYFVD